MRNWRMLPVMAGLMLSCTLISGCAFHRTAQLTPANVVATETNNLVVNFVSHGTPTGEVRVNLPNGDVMTGGFTLFRTQTIYDYNTALLMEVFGRGAIKEGGRIYVNNTPTFSPGIVDVASPSGLSCHCDLINNNFTTHGQGACVFSNGAIYSLTF